MRAVYEAAARIDTRCKNLFDAEILETNSRPHDVDDRINRTDLMKRHILLWLAMYFALCCSQDTKDRQAARFHGFRKRRRFNQLTDVCHGTVFMMMVMMSRQRRRLLILRKQYAHIRCGYPLFLHRLGYYFIFPAPGQFPQFRSKMCKRYARLQECTEQHIAADAGKTVQVNCLHDDNPRKYSPPDPVYNGEATQSRRFILLARTPAPKPLSILTTETPAAQLLSIASNAVKPWNDAP